jgi:hypothetical protein
MVFTAYPSGKASPAWDCRTWGIFAVVKGCG